MDRLTQADLARMQVEHVVYSGPYADHEYPLCADDKKPFPCDAIRLLTELEQRNNAVRTWQGRDHRSPVSHLAGVAYGLLGPSNEAELGQ